MLEEENLRQTDARNRSRVIVSKDLLGGAQVGISGLNITYSVC